jgi:hypothetical protein
MKRAMARAVRVIATVKRVADNKEGKGSKAMVTATRIVGKQWRQQQRWQEIG